MADETEELGLQITGEDLTKGAFASVNGSIEGMKEKTSGLSVHTLKEVQHMQHGFENFANGLSSGNIVEAFRGFIMMVITGFREMGAAMAVATLGISLLIAAAVYLSDRWKKEQSAMAEASKEAAKKHEEAWKKALDLQENALKKGLEIGEKIDADLAESKVSAMKDGTDKEIAQAELTFNKKKALLAKELTELNTNQQYMVQYGTAYGRFVEDKAKELSAIEINAEKEKNNKIKEIKDKAAKDDAARIKHEKDETTRQYKEGQKLLEESTREQQKLLNLAGEDQLDQQIENWRKEQAEAERFAGVLEQAFMDIGAAVGKAMASGKDEFKTAFKEVLQIILSAVEKEVQLGYVGAGARALAGDFSGLFQMAGVTLSFEAAKVAVASFQTPEFGSRRIPGPPNAMKIVGVHGGEEVSRGSSGIGHTIIIKGDYFESEDANSRMFNRLYKYQKRNGVQIQPVRG